MIPLNFRPFNDIDNKIYSALNKSDSYIKMDIQKAKFDEIHVLDDILISNSQNKLEWNYNSVMLAQFKNNLEAGNVSMDNQTISYIKIRKRKKEDLVFEDVKYIPFESNKFDYEYEDKFVESLESYVYALQPVSGELISPTLGKLTISEVDCEYDSAWLVGKGGNQHKLLFNLEVGSYETVIPQQILETIGSQYPFIISNGNVRYRKGNIKARLVSDNTIISGGGIDRKEEKKLRKSIMAFLTDGKPKVYKEGSGEYMLISIMGTPTLTPDNSLSQQIYDISCEFVEVGDTSTNNLKLNGLVI